MRFCATLSYMTTATSLDAANSSTYTVRIPTPLKLAFDQVASLHERNGSQLVREFMRDYVQTNAKQALEHEQWFAQQVQGTRQALKTGKQSSTPASAVHAWLESWGTEAETAAPGARSKAQTQAKVSKSTNTPARKRA
jgi:predicted transcriptional regulator